jgi:hypothetical protein
MLIADTADGVIRQITIPPVSTIKLSPATPNGNNGWYTTAPTVSVTATEKATINCQLDPAAVPPAFSALTSGCTYKGAGAQITTNGQHMFYAASKNSFGDLEPPSGVAINVDIGAPVMFCKAPPGAPPSFTYGTPNAQVLATLEDAISGPLVTSVPAIVDTTALGSGDVLIQGANAAGSLSGVNCPYVITARVLKPVPAVSWDFGGGRGYVSVRHLTVSRVPSFARVALACAGKKCPFVRKHPKVGAGCTHGRCPSVRTVNLAPTIARDRIAAGDVLSVSITAPGTVGRVFQFTIYARTAPSEQTNCLAPGSSTPGKGCTA